MTEALVAFYENKKHKVSVHYDSDGYPSHTGKIISEILSKTPAYDSFSFLVGSYVLSDNSNWMLELLYNEPSYESSSVDYVYSLYYNSESRKIERIDVESYRNPNLFSGDVAEYSEWIKKCED